MTPDQLEQRTIDQEAQIAKNTASIQNIYHQLDNHNARIVENSKTINAIHDLALSVRELSGKVEDVDCRLGQLEHDKRQKHHALWQIIMSAVIGGALTFAVTKILGG